MSNSENQNEDISARGLARAAIEMALRDTDQEQQAEDFEKGLIAIFEDAFDPNAEINSDKRHVDLIGKALCLVVALRSRETSARVGLAFLISHTYYEDPQDAEEATREITEEIDNILGGVGTDRQAVNEAIAGWRQFHAQKTQNR